MPLRSIPLGTREGLVELGGFQSGTLEVLRPVEAVWAALCGL